jgi:hypothetical protein
MEWRNCGGEQRIVVSRRGFLQRRSVIREINLLFATELFMGIWESFFPVLSLAVPMSLHVNWRRDNIVVLRNIP